MDPSTAYTALEVGSGVASIFAGQAEAMNEEAKARSAAYLAETQALQRESVSNDELVRFISTTRAARGANGLSINSPNARILEQDAQTAARRDRLIAKTDDKVRARNFRNAASSYRSSRRMSLLTGGIKSAIPLAEYGINQGWGQ